MNDRSENVYLNNPEQRNTFDCNESGNSRRDFLAHASCAVFAVLAAAGISSVDALSFPVSLTSSETAEGAEHAYPLPMVDGVHIDPDNHVALARVEKHIYAFDLACPHQKVPLRWHPDAHRFECPKHHAKYDSDGAYTSGHKTRNMDRFALHLENDKVIVDLSKQYHSDQQRAEWESAVITL